ncbi:hypothetical protein BT96DRAFT_330760 [Gymnopus androsaceus JB14]|uniref:Uncharacterized protein n=1 Tax=Gymnopus androsaceus JB14 TaxID=1447944 RepID=A0A6A4I968_9AGAR|nr:hypothetical protein BT96DRAFT_330760 [Gymnopus androsaceus JB14]
MSGRAPVIVVFTKLDLLEESVERELEVAEPNLDDDTFNRRTKEEVNLLLEELCYVPFKEKINHDYPLIAVSSLEDHHADQIGALVKLTLEKFRYACATKIQPELSGKSFLKNKLRISLENLPKCHFLFCQ